MDKTDKIDKIDKVLSELRPDEIDELFARILHHRASLVGSNSGPKPSKRLRSGSGQGNEEGSWITVGKGGKPARGEQEAMETDPNTAFQQLPGFPITLNGVPKELVKNSIAISKVVKKVCPEAKIKSQRALADYNRVILYPADLPSSEKLLEANFHSTVLEGITVDRDKKTPSQLSVLLTGIDPCIPEDDIGEELKGQGVHFKSLNRMKTEMGGPTFKVKVDLLDPKMKERLLNNGVYIGYSRHRAVDFKVLPNVLVCFNCQDFGHYAKDCKKAPVCVRCGDEHKVADCTRDSPVCCHCFGFHSGAYKGCPVYKEKQRELAAKRETEKREAAKEHPKPAARVPIPQTKAIEPDYEKISNVLIEVLFIAFDRFAPDPNRNQSSFLSDLCMHTTEAMGFFTKKTFQAPECFSVCKSRLKGMGLFK